MCMEAMGPVWSQLSMGLCLVDAPEVVHAGLKQVKTINWFPLDVKSVGKCVGLIE